MSSVTALLLLVSNLQFPPEVTSAHLAQQESEPNASSGVGGSSSSSSDSPATAEAPSPVATAAAASPEASSPRPGFGFDRVDILSEDTGTWLNYDLPAFSTNATASGIRLVEQLKVSLRTPVRGLYVGLSLGSQSVAYEYPLLSSQSFGLFATGGLQTRLLLPRGLLAGVAVRVWRVRLGASVSLLSQTSWANPNWQQWSVLPTVGIGIGPLYVPPPDYR